MKLLLERKQLKKIIKIIYRSILALYLVNILVIASEHFELEVPILSKARNSFLHSLQQKQSNLKKRQYEELENKINDWYEEYKKNPNNQKMNPEEAMTHKTELKQSIANRERLSSALKVSLIIVNILLIYFAAIKPVINYFKKRKINN